MLERYLQGAQIIAIKKEAARSMQPRNISDIIKLNFAYLNCIDNNLLCMSKH